MENNINIKITHLTVVCSYFYPKIGGLETIAYTTAKKLHQSGKYKVSIITSNYAGKGYKKETIDDMIVHRLPILFKISNTPLNPMWYWQVKKILNVERPDIIHTHSPVPGLVDIVVSVAKNIKIPVIATYHSGSMRKGRWFIDAIISLYERIFLYKLFKRADAIVAVSQSFAKREFPQFAYKTFFIPTGVDLGRFKKTPIPYDEEVVTFVGRLERTSMWKGVDQLLKAMAIVLKNRPNAKLKLVGGGDAIDYYRELAREFNIESSVEMLGPQYGQALVDAYCKSMIIVLPSTSDSEAFSVALVEAMASGRPVIGTNIGGTPQVISNESDGLLIEPKNPQALALAIERILSDHALAQQFGDAGAQKSQKFSWELQIEKYQKLFEKVLEAKQKQ